MRSDQIKEFVEERTNIKIAAKKQDIETLRVRWTFYYLCIRYASDHITYSYLGRLTNKSHATVIHGLKKFKEYYDTDRDFRTYVYYLEEHVKNVAPKEDIEEFQKLDRYTHINILRKYKNIMHKHERLIDNYSNLKQQLKAIKKSFKTIEA